MAKKILIAEDYHDLLDFFSIFLKMHDFEVRGASSKEEIYAHLEDFRPDLILMDVVLGSHDGRELCKEIKKTHKHVSIILLSANPAFLTDHTECDPEETIEKPFSNEDLLKKINKVLRN
jgi:DNA-binding response OmpR family regulator